MIRSLIAWSLKQRLVLAVVMLIMTLISLFSIRSLSVDAFPDVTNVQGAGCHRSAGPPPRRSRAG